MISSVRSVVLALMIGVAKAQSQTVPMVGMIHDASDSVSKAPVFGTIDFPTKANAGPASWR